MVTCDDKGLPRSSGIERLTSGRMQCPTPAEASRILPQVIASAVRMLDNTIGELVRAREAACRGAPLGWPNLGEVTACWLKYRLGVCIDDISTWTNGTFKSRAVAEIIRRLVRPRNLIASNAITYVCEASCNPGTHAWVRVRNNGVCIRTPERLIHLCPPFWAVGNAKFREQTLIHEAVHLTHCAGGAEDSEPRASIGSPECLAQFVAATNGKELDPNFISRCLFTTKCGPVPKGCRASAGKRTLRDWQPELEDTLPYVESLEATEKAQREEMERDCKGVDVLKWLEKGGPRSLREYIVQLERRLDATPRLVEGHTLLRKLKGMRLAKDRYQRAVRGLVKAFPEMEQHRFPPGYLVRTVAEELAQVRCKLSRARLHFLVWNRTGRRPNDAGFLRRN